jgi:hypothetical protein
MARSCPDYDADLSPRDLTKLLRERAIRLLVTPGYIHAVRAVASELDGLGVVTGDLVQRHSENCQTNLDEVHRAFLPPVCVRPVVSS